LLFPILKKHNEWAASGYVASRVIESVLLLTASACVLIPVINSETSAGINGAFMGLREVLFQLAMISLGMGSVLFCGILLSSRLTPRFLSVLGIIGYIALFISGWLELFSPSQLSVILFIPGALFELAFPVWLFIKGFCEREAVVNEK